MAHDMGIRKLVGGQQSIIRLKMSLHEDKLGLESEGKCSYGMSHILICFFCSDIVLSVCLFFNWISPMLESMV